MNNDVKSLNEYPALKGLMFWFKLLGVLLIIFGVFLLVAFLTATANNGLSLLFEIGILIGVFIIGLFLFGFSELLKVLINTEHNTKMNYSINKSLEEIKKNMNALLLKQIDNDI